MTRSSSSLLEEFDPEIERTFTRSLRERKQHNFEHFQVHENPMAEPNNGGDVEAGPPPRHRGNQAYEEPQEMTLRDYASVNAQGPMSSIRKPPVNNNNFELKPAFINMLQNACQFYGLTSEDPNAHLASFIECCDTLKINGASDDAIRLRLFTFTLRDKAKDWLNSFPRESITTWEDLTSKFLAKYFPPSKTIKLRNDIITFRQDEGESLYEACERYKDALRRCPHHGVPQWLIIQGFYNGLRADSKSSIDSAVGGSIQSKGLDEAWRIIEDMVSNGAQSSTEQHLPKRGD